MPSKKKKYNARFPAGRIKKIMQTDEEVGKVAQAVPVIISRTLELFVESLLTKSMQITQSRNAKTLTPSHMKQCILSESRFDFLKDLVKNIPDASVQEDNENNAAAEVPEKLTEPAIEEETPTVRRRSRTETEIVTANFYVEQGTSTTAGRTPVIQYVPKIEQQPPPRLSFSVENLVKRENKLQVDVTNVPPPPLVLASPDKAGEGGSSAMNPPRISSEATMPQLIPISHNFYAQSSGDNLYIDEDYDN